MLNWFYQLVLSVLTRILSWFGLSWGKDLKDAVDAVEAVQTASTDEPPVSEPSVEAYSADAAGLAPVAE